MSVLYDPATADHEVAQATLGAVYWHNGKAYKYVQFKDAVTYAAGHVVTWANTSGTAVTNDRAGGSDIGTGVEPAGVATRVHTQNYYGFMQVAGTVDVYYDGSVAAGEWIVSDTGADGRADTMAAGEEEQVIGIALEADSGTPVTALVSLQGLI